MNIEILNLAELDLLDGFHFYETQEAGLGFYFLESVYSDIESLRRNAGIHFKPHKKFRSQFIMQWLMKPRLSMRLLIAAATRLGSASA